MVNGFGFGGAGAGGSYGNPTPTPPPTNTPPVTPVPMQTDMPMQSNLTDTLPVNNPTPPPIQNQNVAPVVKPKVTNIKPTNIVTPGINQPGGMSDIEAMSTKPIKQTPLTQSKEYLQTLSNNLKDKLKQQVQAGMPIDNAVRDDMFSQAVKDLGGNFDVNNPQAESIRKYVYDNALLGLQLGKDQNKTWDDYYGKTINQIERGQMISQIPSDEIAKRLVDGDLTYRDIRVLNATNPEKLKEISMLKRKYTTMKNANNIVSGGGDSTTTTITTPTMEETITENGNIVDTTIENIATSTVPDAKGTLAEQYDAMLNTPEIKAARDALIPVNEQIKLLELEKSNLAQTIEGKVTDKALFNAIYRDEAAGIDDALSALYIKQGTLAGTYNMLEQDAKDKFNVHLKDLEMQSSARQSQQDTWFKMQALGMQQNQLALQQQEFGLAQQKNVFDQIEKLGGYMDNAGNFIKVDLFGDSANMGLSVGQQQGRLGSIGTGNVTNLANSIDIDGNIGDAISIPYDATVISSGVEQATGNKYVTVQTSDGKVLQFNHLESTGNGMQSMDLAPGTVIPAGSVFATLGNSGDVKDAQGNWLRRGGVVQAGAEGKLAQGLGSHLDFRGWDSVEKYNSANRPSAQMDFGQLANYMNGQTQTRKTMSADDMGYMNYYFQQKLPTGVDYNSPQGKAYRANSTKYYENFVNNLGDNKKYLDILRNNLNTAASNAEQQMKFSSFYDAAINQDKEQMKNLAIQAIANGKNGAKFLPTMTLLETVNRTEQLINDYKASGKNMGILKGTWEDLANKLGTSSDLELQEIGQNLGFIANNYVLTNAGTTFTDSYLGRMNNLIGDKGNTIDRQLSLLKGLKDNIYVGIGQEVYPKIGGKAVFDDLFMNNAESTPQGEQTQMQQIPVIGGRWAPTVYGQ